MHVTRNECLVKYILNSLIFHFIYVISSDSYFMTHILKDYWVNLYVKAKFYIVVELQLHFMVACLVVKQLVN